jgi:hypothetical protein
MSVPTPIAVIAQKSGCHHLAPAATPPITGPSATAPKIPRFITTPVVGIRRAGQPITSGGTAAISSIPVVRPCAMRPATNQLAAGDHAASTDPTR